MLLISGTSLSHSPAREAVFTAIAMAKRNGTRVAFDLDYRDYTWNNRQEAAVYLTLAAEKADIVLGTRDEFDVMEALLHPSNRNDAQSAAWLLEKGVSLVSIKKGRLGSLIYSHQGVTAGGIYPAKVLKTFGAGDSYSSAFNWGLIHGKTLEESLRYAAAASAITITGHILKQRWLVVFGIIGGLGCFGWETLEISQRLLIVFGGVTPAGMALVSFVIPCFTIFLFALVGLTIPGLIVKKQRL